MDLVYSMKMFGYCFDDAQKSRWRPDYGKQYSLTIMKIGSALCNHRNYHSGILNNIKETFIYYYLTKMNNQFVFKKVKEGKTNRSFQFHMPLKQKIIDENGNTEEKLNMVKAETLTHFDEWKSVVADDCNESKNCAFKNAKEKGEKYVERLEESCVSLTSQNDRLKAEVATLREDNTTLKNYVRYLKSVMGNSNEVGLLVKGIKNVPGLKLNLPLKRKMCESSKEKCLEFKKWKLNDNSLNSDSLENNFDPILSGMSFHIGNENVSVELYQYNNDVIDDDDT